MEIGISILLVILTVLIDSTLFIQLKNRKNSQLESLTKEYESLENDLQQAQDRLAKLKVKRDELTEELGKAKQEAEERNNTPVYTPEVNPEEILLQEKIITPKQLKKAKDYIKRNSVNLTIIDALLLLNTIDSDTASYIKDKIKQLQQPRPVC